MRRNGSVRYFGVEDSDEMIVTRKLSQDSKSSLRVNGIPFTLGMLKSVTSLLVDVHGQSEHYSLLKESEQLAGCSNGLPIE